MASQVPSKASTKQLRIIGPYQIGEVIGRGSCGIVYKGLNRQNGQLVAIKQVSLDNIKEDLKGSVKNEIRLLKDFEHDKIVKYLDCIQSEEHLNIVLEYVENGSLDSLIKKFGKIPESLVTVYIHQVLEGLVFLHEKGIIHRDIKGGNILTTKDGEVKLADFSVATMLNQDQNSQVSINNMSFAGTPYWMAPEVIQEDKKITSACDIWSLGCTVIELLTEKPPYYDLNRWTALIKIVDEKNPPIPENLSDDLNDFLRLCFEIDPEKRSSAKTLLDHPWLRKAKKADEKGENSAEKQIMPVEHQKSTDRDGKGQEPANDFQSRLPRNDNAMEKKESKRNSLKASNQIHIAIKDLAKQAGASGGRKAEKVRHEVAEQLALSPQKASSINEIKQGQSDVKIQDARLRLQNPSLITSKSHSHSTSKMSQRSNQNAATNLPQLQVASLPPQAARQQSPLEAQGPGVHHQFNYQELSNNNLKFNYGNLGETGENLKLWAINEIVEVFDKEMKPAFSDLEELPCEVNQDDAQVDDESESVVEKFREVAQKMSDKIRQLLSVLKGPGSVDNNQGQLRQLDRAADSYAPSYLGQTNINLQNVPEIMILDRLSTLRLVKLLETPENLKRLPIPDSQQQQLQIDIYFLQQTAMQLINQVCDDVPQNYIQLCLSGIVSQLKEMAKGGSQTPKELRVEIAYFILKAYVTCNEAVMMIFSCEGYKILTEFLRIDSQSTQDSLSANKLLIFMAIDVFLLHFSPMLNQFLPTRKDLQSIFLNECIHERLGEILEKLCLDGEEGAGSQALLEQRVEIKEERKVELKYVDKIFELLGHLVQAASLNTKAAFSVVVEASLVKIVRKGIERKDLSESTIAGKATRRFLKLIALLTFGMHASDLKQITLFKRRHDDRRPGAESQVMKCLVDILRLYARTLDGQKAPSEQTQAIQQQAHQSSQLTLIYDTLKLLSNLCSYSSDLCKQASSGAIHEELDPLARSILNLSPPLSLTKSLKLLTHLLSLFRNIHSNEDALSRSQVALQPSLFMQLLKFAYSHLFQILGKGNNQGKTNLHNNQKVAEKLNLLHQICDNSCYLGLQYGKRTENQADNGDWSQTIPQIYDCIGSLQQLVSASIHVQGHWTCLVKYADWTREALQNEKSIRLLTVKSTSANFTPKSAWPGPKSTHNYRIDSMIKCQTNLMELVANREAQVNADSSAFGQLDSDPSMIKQEKAHLAKYVLIGLKIIEVVLFKAIDELGASEGGGVSHSEFDPPQAVGNGASQGIHEHLDTDIVSDSSSQDQAGRNCVTNSRFFIDYLKKYLDTMPSISTQGNLVAYLRWLRIRFDKEQEISKAVDSILEPLIKTYEREGEQVPQEFQELNEQMQILQSHHLNEFGFPIQPLNLHQHNQSQHQALPQRTKNKSQNLVIKNASRHFVQNHESEEDQVQLIQQIQLQQQRLQGKKLPIKKLNTYKPQQVARMTDSYNSASNVKRGPPLMAAPQPVHHHVMYQQQPDGSQEQLYEEIIGTQYYQSTPQMHSQPSQYIAPGHHQELVMPKEKSTYEAMSQQPMPKQARRQEMSVIRYVNQHRSRQMIAAETSPSPQYQASQIAHSANNTGYVGQMNLSQAMRHRQQYFQHHDAGSADIQGREQQHGENPQGQQARRAQGAQPNLVRQQSSNSHQGHHGLPLQQSNIQYQSANQQKSSTKLQVNPGQILLTNKNKPQKVFKNTPNQTHPSTQLNHTRNSTQSASAALLHQQQQASQMSAAIQQQLQAQQQYSVEAVATSGQFQQHVDQEQQYQQPRAKKGRDARTGKPAQGNIVQTPQQQAPRNLACRPLPKDAHAQQQMYFGQYPIQVQAPEGRKGPQNRNGSHNAGQRGTAHGRIGRKGGGLRPSRSNNTQSMNVMCFQSLEHGQGLALTEQAFYEGAESQGPRGKIQGSQYKYAQSNLQRPLATEPAGGYSHEYQNQLGDIEEGEESGDGGPMNMENAIEEEELNLGGGNFVYEKQSLQQRKRNKNKGPAGTSAFGQAQAVEMQPVSNPPQLLRSKSRDGAARSRGGLIQAPGPPNLFKNNSQLTTKASGPGALMKSNDNTPTFPPQAHPQQQLYPKKLSRPVHPPQPLMAQSRDSKAFPAPHFLDEQPIEGRPHQIQKQSTAQFPPQQLHHQVAIQQNFFAAQPSAGALPRRIMHPQVQTAAHSAIEDQYHGGIPDLQSQGWLEEDEDDDEEDMTIDEVTNIQRAQPPPTFNGEKWTFQGQPPQELSLGPAAFYPQEQQQFFNNYGQEIDEAQGHRLADQYMDDDGFYDDEDEDDEHPPRR